MVFYGLVTYDVISGDVFGGIENRYPRCTTTWYVLHISIGTMALAPFSLGGDSRTSFIMVVYGQMTYDVISADVFGRIEKRYPRCTTTWHVLPFGIGTVALAP